MNSFRGWHGNCYLFGVATSQELRTTQKQQKKEKNNETEHEKRSDSRDCGGTRSCGRGDGLGSPPPWSCLRPCIRRGACRIAGPAASTCVCAAASGRRPASSCGVCAATPGRCSSSSSAGLCSPLVMHAGREGTRDASGWRMRPELTRIPPCAWQQYSLY